MNIVDIAILLAAISLISVGIVLLRKWNQQYKESFFYWGFGLCLWGAGLLMDVLYAISILPTNATTLFIRNYLVGLAFVFFLLYGTLLFILKKRQANLTVGVYFFVFFIVNVIINSSTDSVVVLSVWHNILFITPPSLVFGVYYYYHYRNLKKGKIWMIYNLWILFAIIAFAYTFLYSIGLATELALMIWSLIYSVIVILLTITYLLLMFTETHVWHKITKSLDYVIDDDLKRFFEDYFFDQAGDIIKEEMERIGVTKLRAATRFQRMTFIDNCVKNQFSRLLSVQRQEIIRAKLLSILGVRMDSSITDDYGVDLVRM